jgi:hypothetical protein
MSAKLKLRYGMVGGRIACLGAVSGINTGPDREILFAAFDAAFSEDKTQTELTHKQ